MNTTILVIFEVPERYKCMLKFSVNYGARLRLNRHFSVYLFRSTTSTLPSTRAYSIWYLVYSIQ
jgi:hypothetical protein